MLVYALVSLFFNTIWTLPLSLVPVAVKLAPRLVVGVGRAVKEGLFPDCSYWNQQLEPIEQLVGIINLLITSTYKLVKVGSSACFGGVLQVICVVEIV